MIDNKQVNIVRGLKTLEWLKNQMLSDTTNVFVSLTEGSIENTVNSLADMVISCYLLSKRLNVSFDQLEAVLLEKVRYSREHSRKAGYDYEDLSELLYYLRARKKE